MSVMMVQTKCKLNHTQLFLKLFHIQCREIVNNKRYEETKKSEALEAARPISAGAYPDFCSMKRLEVFLLPLDGMLVHRRSLPRKLSGFPQQFAGTHLYTWVERGTVRVKCLA